MTLGQLDLRVSDLCLIEIQEYIEGSLKCKSMNSMLLFNIQEEIE